jgi:hypothetical protein
MNKIVAIAEGLAEMVEAVAYPTQADFVAEAYDFDPYCFVCERATCHVGEHEDLYEAGLVTYNPNGWVGVVAWV